MGYRGAIPTASGIRSIELSDLDDIQTASLSEHGYQRGIVKVFRCGVGVSGRINSRSWNSGRKENPGDARTQQPVVRLGRDAIAEH